MASTSTGPNRATAQGFSDRVASVDGLLGRRVVGFFECVSAYRPDYGVVGPVFGLNNSSTWMRGDFSRWRGRREPLFQPERFTFREDQLR
ncbi:hypothetical protein KCP73_13900 [Salmonella enterica subsp. enterica]|nr:hypothetical protein KCP73_13900 [Salmonella enterica subsp. enterica]